MAQNNTSNIGVIGSPIKKKQVPAGVLAHLKDQFQSAISTYENAKREINKIGSIITLKLKKAPRRPRETAAEFDEQIRKLEYKRFTSTLSLKDEKHILKDIEKIRRAKKEITLYDAFQSNIDKMREQQDRLRNVMNTQNASIAELKQGISIINLSNRLHIAPSQIIKVSMEIKESELGYVIGKGGNSVKSIEEFHGVIIDIGGKGVTANTIIISGDTTRCEAAQTEITEMVENGEEEYPVNPSIFNALLAFKSANLIKIEEDCRVRIGLDRDGGNLLLRGASKCKDLAKEKLREIIELGTCLEIEENIVATVIGRKGERIRKIQDECNVEIDCDKSSGDKPILRIYGDDDNVIRAKATLEIFIEENTLHTEAYDDVDADVAIGLIGTKGSIIRKLETESGAYINISLPKKNKDGNEEVEPVEDGPILSVRGTKDALAKARILIETEMEKQSRENVKLVVEETLLNYIRVNVKTLQKESGATIDTVKTRGIIRVRGDEESVVKAVAVINEIKSDFTSLEIEVQSGILGALVGKGGHVIQKIQKDTGAVIDIKREDGSEEAKLTIYGSPVIVEKAKEAVEVILDENYMMKVDLIDTNLIGAFCGKAGVHIKEVQAKFEKKVTIDLEKENVSLSLRGPTQMVKECSDFIIEWRDRYRKENKELQLTPNQISLLTMATAKEIRQESGANINVISRASKVIIKGKEDALEKAVELIKNCVGFGEELSKVEFNFPSQFFGAFLGKGGVHIQRLQKEYDCVINTERETNKIVLLGKKENVTAAHENLEKYLKEEVKVFKETKIPRDRISELVGRNGKVIQGLQASTGTNIYIEKEDKQKPSTNKFVMVTVRGNAEGVLSACQTVEDIGTGRVRVVMKLLPEQVSALEGRAEFNLTRVGEECKSTITLDKTNNTLNVLGTESNVSKAHISVFFMLKFFCPGQFSNIKVNKNTVAALDKQRGAKISSIAYEHDVFACIDTIASYILVHGDSDGVSKVEAEVMGVLRQFEKENIEISIPDRLISMIIGKSGTSIKQIREATGADVNVEDNTSGGGAVVTISSNDEEKVKAAKVAIELIIQNDRENNCEIEIDPSENAVVIGKGGATIRKIQEETGARINLDKGSSIVVIRGNNLESTQKAKEAIEAVLEEWRASKPVHEYHERKDEDNLRKPKKKAAPTPTPETAKPVFCYDGMPIGMNPDAMQGSNKSKQQRSRKNKKADEHRKNGSTDEGSNAVLGLLLVSENKDESKLNTSSETASNVMKPPPGFPMSCAMRPAPGLPAPTTIITQAPSDLLSSLLGLPTNATVASSANSGTGYVSSTTVDNKSVSMKSSGSNNTSSHYTSSSGYSLRL